tara:strand:- start:113 stop:298 length:186 start_codon:yes stop_codon:yes gene_type:complete
MLIEYEARMVSGERIYFLSENVENAAWDAFHLAEASDDILADVIPTELLNVRQEKDQEVFS